MTVPVPGLSDERLAEIEILVNGYLPPDAPSHAGFRALLAEVVRLREERDKAQRRAAVALSQVGGISCAHSVTVWTCAGCIARRVRAALAIEDGQTSKQSPIGCPDVEPHEPHQYTVRIGGVTCEGGLCDGVDEETSG